MLGYENTANVKNGGTKLNTRGNVENIKGGKYSLIKNFFYM